jgi:hypothetical protein
MLSIDINRLDPISPSLCYPSRLEERLRFWDVAHWHEPKTTHHPHLYPTGASGNLERRRNSSSDVNRKQGTGPVMATESLCSSESERRESFAKTSPCDGTGICLDKTSLGSESRIQCTVSCPVDLRTGTSVSQCSVHRPYSKVNHCGNDSALIVTVVTWAQLFLPPRYR